MARGRFLIGGTVLMTLSIAAMGLATAYWQIVLLAMVSGLGNSVIHPADYAILVGLGRPRPDRPLVRPAYLCRPCRVRRRAAGHRRADAADRLAPHLAAGRSAGGAGGAGDPVAEPHPQRAAAAAARARARLPRRSAPAAVAPDPDVLRLLHGVVDGRGGHPVLADHGVAQHPRADPRSRRRRR